MNFDSNISILSEDTLHLCTEKMFPREIVSLNNLLSRKLNHIFTYKTIGTPRELFRIFFRNMTEMADMLRLATVRVIRILLRLRGYNLFIYANLYLSFDDLQLLQITCILYLSNASFLFIHLV